MWIRRTTQCTLVVLEDAALHLVGSCGPTIIDGAMTRLAAPAKFRGKTGRERVTTTATTQTVKVRDISPSQRNFFREWIADTRNIQVLRLDRTLDRMFSGKRECRVQ